MRRVRKDKGFTRDYFAVEVAARMLTSYGRLSFKFNHNVDSVGMDLIVKGQMKVNR